MGLFGSSGKTLVGVDIGSSAIKIISGQKSRKGLSVDRFVAVPLPPHAVDERGITQRDLVVQALNSGLDAIGKGRGLVATQIHGPSVLLKHVLMQAVSEKDIREMAAWEAEQVFSVDRDSILIDCVLGDVRQLPGAPSGNKGREVVLVGVRVEEAQQIQSVFSECHSEVRVMDVDAFVTSDFLEGLVHIPANGVLAFVDIGASATRVSVKKGKNLIFFREFGIAGKSFTEVISRTLGLSYEDAEALKISDGAGIPTEALQALSASFTSWKNELQQCEDLFVSQEDSGLISQWNLFGGGSLTPGLLDSLQDKRFAGRISILPAENMFSPKNKNVDPNVLRHWSPRLISAAGLSMRKG